MRKVFLLTGFQNWGKTWLISALFGNKKRFLNAKLYPALGHKFCVIPQSNDDLGEEGYKKKYKLKMKALNKGSLQPQYIISAFCPTKENINQSRRIIDELYSNDEVVLIPIEYKWCTHAKLRIPEITSYFSGLNNFHIENLSPQNPTLKLAALQSILQRHLP